MKRFLRAIIVLLVFFASKDFASAVTRTKLIDSPDANVVTYGTSADSKYAYSFRVNNNSSIRETNACDKPNVNCVLTERYLVFIPESDQGSGETYIWINDVGRYNGKKVDLKLTLYWKTQTIDSTLVYPYIFINLNNVTGFIDYYFSTLAYEVKHEVFSNGEKLDVDMSFLLGDIDSNQYFGIKANTGSINSIQSVTGSRVFYDESNGYKWVYDGYRDFSQADTSLPDNGAEQERQHTVRLELEGTNSFNLIIGSDIDTLSYSDMFLAPVVDCVNEETGELKVSPERVKDLILGRNATILDDNLERGVVVLQASAYGPYTVPRPTLLIEDKDGVLKTETTMTDLSDQVIYKAFSQVPQETREFYYNAYSMVVNLADEVSASSVKVFNESGEDVTTYFSVANEGNKYTFTAKSTALISESFYSDTYIYTFTTNLVESAKNEATTSGQIEFDASAMLSIMRNGELNGSSANTVNTIAYYIPEGSPNQSEPSNPTFQILTDVVNGTIDDASTVKEGNNVTVTYKANPGFKISKLIIDGEEIEINGYKTSFTFNNVSKDHTIKVIYVEDDTLPLNPPTGAFALTMIVGLVVIGSYCFINVRKGKKLFYKI